MSHGLQGAEDLKANLAKPIEVSIEAKTRETIVTHVEADLEDTPQPPTWHAKCRWISYRKNMGYHAKVPKDSNAGGCTCEI
jgi:hypothetical protein